MIGLYETEADMKVLECPDRFQLRPYPRCNIDLQSFTCRGAKCPMFREDRDANGFHGYYCGKGGKP